jgi:hypothetical protein
MRISEVAMAGRFGTYGDAKHNAQTRNNRLRPPDFRQPAKNKPLGRGINDSPVCMNWDTAIRSFQVLSREFIIALVLKGASKEQGGTRSSGW